MADQDAGPRKDTVQWSNCRLVLAGEKDDDDEFPGGVIGRLFFTSASHPSVRAPLQTLAWRTDIDLRALTLHSLVNGRGPDALVGAIPGAATPAAARNAAALLALAAACHAAGAALAAPAPGGAALVLVPRDPAAAAEDSLFFVAYSTNLPALALAGRLRTERRVAVVLDLDQTLVDATPLAPRELAALEPLLAWEPAPAVGWGGAPVAGARRAPLPPPADPRLAAEFVVSWRARAGAGPDAGPVAFRVRVRAGWPALRAHLAAGADRFLPYVCSKGKLEYVQLIWGGLDPAGALIPEAEWPARVASTFPDTLARAAPKTALVALGCAPPGAPGPPARLAAPLLCLDDAPDAYAEASADCVLYVEEFRPSGGVHADAGAVLRGAAAALDAYHEAACGASGPFAWQAAGSFATALLGALRRAPIESPAALGYVQARCARMGGDLWSQVTVAALLRGGTYLADPGEPGASGGNSAAASLGPSPLASPLGSPSKGSSADFNNGLLLAASASSSFLAGGARPAAPAAPAMAPLAAAAGKALPAGHPDAPRGGPDPAAAEAEFLERVRMLQSC